MEIILKFPCGEKFNDSYSYNFIPPFARLCKVFGRFNDETGISERLLCGPFQQLTAKIDSCGIELIIIGKKKKLRAGFFYTDFKQGTLSKVHEL